MKKILALLLFLIPALAFSNPTGGSELANNAGTAAWITDGAIPMSIGTGGNSNLCLFTNGQSRVCINGNGDMILGLTKKLKIGEGTNASMGHATLVNGSVTVSTNVVTTNSEIFFSVQTALGIPGLLQKANVVGGSSFDIVSSSAGDNSVVSWLIIDPG